LKVRKLALSRHSAKQLFLGVFCLLLSACSSELPPTSGDITAPSNTAEVGVKINLTTTKPTASLRQHLAAASSQALTAAEQLANKVQTFSDTPQLANLQQALNSWEHAHMSYLLAKSLIVQTLRHPILDQAQIEPTVIHPITVRLDQFPMINGYLDAVQGYPKSGLMHSEATLSLESLNTEHQFSDPSYVALGFHALKFMLIGDDNTLEGTKEGNTAEDRLKDYIPPTTAASSALISSVEAANEASSTDMKSNTDSDHQKAVLRRKHYLKLLTKQIVVDIGLIDQEWQSEEGFYQQHFSAFTPQDNKRYLTLLEKEHAQRIAGIAEGGSSTAEHLNADTITESTKLLNRLKASLL